MHSLRAEFATIVFMMLLSLPALAGEKESEPSPRDVIARLDALADRIAKLDQRILRLERILVKQPVRIDDNGIIRDENGRPVGVWGIDTRTTMMPNPR